MVMAEEKGSSTHTGQETHLMVVMKKKRGNSWDGAAKIELQVMMIVTIKGEEKR